MKIHTSMMSIQGSLCTSVSVHVGAQRLSPGDNLKKFNSIFSIILCLCFEPLYRQRDE